MPNLTLTRCKTSYNVEDIIYLIDTYSITTSQQTLYRADYGHTTLAIGVSRYTIWAFPNQ